jgi:hypothetical protein
MLLPLLEPQASALIVQSAPVSVSVTVFVQGRRIAKPNGSR